MLRPTVVFDSRDLPVASAIEAWREMTRSTVHIGIDKEHRERFSISLRAVRLRETVVTAVATTTQAFHRDPGRVRRDGLDQYGFFFQATGSRMVRANGIDRVLRPGDLQFVDMAQEDFTLAADGRTTTLYVPRHLVDAEFPEAWRLHGMVMRSTAARVFADQALTLFDPDGAWPATMAGFLERSLLALAIGSLIETRREAAPLTRGDLDLPLRRRIEHYIEDNLPDLTLDASRIGQEFGISRSVIYRVFHAHGGLNRYILGRRLHRVRKLLMAGDARTIAEIAFATGFGTPAHFNREFRRTFGTTPSEVRTLQRSIGHDPVEAASLDQLFRSLDP
jgi:AraC-like DNA-binding protein